MLTRSSITTLLIIAVVIWGGFLWVRGIELNWDHAEPFTFTVSVLTGLVWLFDRYLWKWRLLDFLGVKPSLIGTWRVELQSTWCDPKTGVRANPVMGFAVIRQTYSSISIRIMTREAESFLKTSRFDKQDDGVTFLFGAYQSDPSIHARQGASEIHYGSFQYKLVGHPVEQIVGHYWTDRSTKGSITIDGRKKVLFDSYESAEEGYAGAPA